MQTVAGIRELREKLLPWREAGESVGLVPTMGALHAGHMALVAAAKKSAGRVVATIFVNPTQFAPHEDFARYPRQPEADAKLLAEAGCDLLYMPQVTEMYPQDCVTAVDPGPLGKLLEGEFRPGHFTGVATVVVKLLLQTLPDIAFFGEKDYQQLQVIRRVARDIDIPTYIAGVPTVRDTDGLALSSRNVYLSVDERARALALPRTLQESAARLKTGEAIETILTAGRARLTAAGFRVDYLELADAASLQPVRALHNPTRLLAAAHMGKTRLIDNVAVRG
jgi:pantoate--beta-alanine ligase